MVILVVLGLKPYRNCLMHVRSFYEFMVYRKRSIRATMQMIFDCENNIYGEVKTSKLETYVLYTSCFFFSPLTEIHCIPNTPKMAQQDNATPR